MSEKSGAIINSVKGSGELFCENTDEYKKESEESQTKYPGASRGSKINSELLKGYKEMAEINLRLAEDGISSDNCALELCEQKLAESECCDS